MFIFCLLDPVCAELLYGKKLVNLSSPKNPSSSSSKTSRSVINTSVNELKKDNRNAEETKKIITE
ncbi:unnamed protein product [Amaranthus hypochondriacus]